MKKSRAAEPDAGAAPVAVLAASAALEPSALALAGELGLSCLETGRKSRDISEFRTVLLLDDHGLALQQTGPGAPGALRVDFGSGAMRHRRRGGQNELLGRAVGVGKRPELAVLDATAGLARDSFVLADLGCRVLACERDPVIHALLCDGLRRAAAADDDWLRQTSARISVAVGEAQALAVPQLASLDVIYLDPMFPARSRHVAVKRDLALLQLLLREQGAADAGALLDWALQQDVARVVVKRPLKAGELGGREPSHRLAGRAVRFDVYVLRGFA